MHLVGYSCNDGKFKDRICNLLISVVNLRTTSVNMIVSIATCERHTKSEDHGWDNFADIIKSNAITVINWESQ